MSFKKLFTYGALIAAGVYVFRGSSSRKLAAPAREAEETEEPVEAAQTDEVETAKPMPKPRARKGNGKRRRSRSKATAVSAS